MVYFCSAWITLPGNWTRIHPPSDLFKLALLRGHGSHSLQIFTSGSGSWCLTDVPLGGALPPPKKKNLGAKFFSSSLGSGVWSKLFLAIVPEKEYPKLVLKFWGLPPQKKIAGGMGWLKISPNFAIFRLFCPFLQDGARYRESKNWFVIYGHSSTRW